MQVGEIAPVLFRREQPGADSPAPLPLTLPTCASPSARTVSRTAVPRLPRRKHGPASRQRSNFLSADQFSQQAGLSAGLRTRFAAARFAACGAICACVAKPSVSQEPPSCRTVLPTAERAETPQQRKLQWQTRTGGGTTATTTAIATKADRISAAAAMAAAAHRGGGSEGSRGGYAGDYPRGSEWERGGGGWRLWPRQRLGRRAGRLGLAPAAASAASSAAHGGELGGGSLAAALRRRVRRQLARRRRWRLRRPGFRARQQPRRWRLRLAERRRRLG